MAFSLRQKSEQSILVSPIMLSIDPIVPSKDRNHEEDPGDNPCHDFDSSAGGAKLFASSGPVTPRVYVARHPHRQTDLAFGLSWEEGAPDPIRVVVSGLSPARAS